MYHPYFSGERVHFAVFTDFVITEILNVADANDDVKIVESDKCTNQYKSAAHCFKLQQLSDAYQKTIIGIWSIARQGKGEVDHVGGIAKVAIRNDIAGGMFFRNAEEMVSHLSEKFAEKIDPCYIFKNISLEQLLKGREEDHYQIFKTIDGSSSFQVAVFSPGTTSFRAAPYLCNCNQCKITSAASTSTS